MGQENTGFYEVDVAAQLCVTLMQFLINAKGPGCSATMGKLKNIDSTINFTWLPQTWYKKCLSVHLEMHNCIHNNYSLMEVLL